MRSAGGTESAVTMLIADHVRKAVGLSKYQANSFDDETGRFVEELRIYEREASSFQFHILDEDIERVISNRITSYNVCYTKLLRCNGKGRFSKKFRIYNQRFDLARHSRTGQKQIRN